MTKNKDKATLSLGALIRALADSPLPGFFMGRWYPIAVCALVLIGHVLAIEIWTAMLIIISVSLALLVCPSTRPLIPVACTFLFQLSVEHSPALPNYSDYCFSGWRLPIVAAMLLMLVAALTLFAVKKRIFEGISLLRTPLLLPLAVFALSLVTGGAFSSEWTVASLLYGTLQAFTFTFFFVCFLFGMRTESTEDAAGCFAYTSALTAIVLVGELAVCYIETLLSGEEIIKGDILFGWGVWNSMGAALCMLIPACFIGVVKNNGVRSFAYLGAAVLALFGAVMTMSRNALLFGCIFFAASVAIASLAGYHKRFYRALIALGAIGIAVAAIALHDRIPALVASFLDDNGRLVLWEMGIEQFLSSPIFGAGFFAFEFPDDPNYFVGADFLPSFVHQTLIQLLASTGAIGLLSYLYYRVSTVVCACRRPSAIGFLLLLTSLVIPAMSLIDTFIFNFWPVIHYSIALAVMCKCGLRDAEIQQINENKRQIGEKS